MPPYTYELRVKSPVVVEKKYFVMKVEHSKALFLVQFDPETGKPIWSRNMSFRRTYTQEIAEVAAKNSNGVIAQL